MADREDRKAPLLVAVWPGMGQVALTAGYYLMSKLHMHETEPLATQDLFDVNQVEIRDGLVRTERLPRSRIFLRNDAAEGRDVIVLIGEAQPPSGNLTFCRRLLDYAERRGVREVFTFAAMADDVPLGARARVFGVATHAEGRETLKSRGVEVLSGGRITGLNGILLGAAAERGLHGIGLLGEMPAMVIQVPFAKASSAVLRVFDTISGIRIDLGELEEYGRTVEAELSEVVDRIRKATEDPDELSSEEESSLLDPKTGVPDEPRNPAPTDEERRRLEELFAQASRERSRAFELKRELDRLGVFDEYEGRFLDLFRKPPEHGKIA
jgi:proteasome assembly chaperone (PAC2) family protein